MIPKTNNRWTFIKRVGKLKAKCKCKCGSEKEIYLSHYKDGQSKSCGCLQKEATKKICSTHGMTGTKFYKTWQALKGRCNNPNHTDYKNYGARGIIVEWNSFEEFWNDMYYEFLIHDKQYGGQQTTIERLDNNKNYCKSNCCWATRKEQNRNKR